VPRRAALLVAAALGCTAPADDAAVVVEQVREAFRHAWTGYVEHAWGHDELTPLTGGSRDWYDASLLMTPLDAFDTMLLMGLDDEAAAAKRLIFDSLSFDRDVPAQVFEITIRHLGALITAYQMDGDQRFLALAIDLADRLLPAFETPTGMPYRYVNLRTGAISDSINNPAEIGTLILELGSLSNLTGNPVYYDKAKRGMRAVFDRRSPIGLVGETIDVVTGDWDRTASHISGRIDSWYEYLYKAWRLFGDPDFRRMWEESITAVNRYLPDARQDGYWYGHVDMNTGERIATQFGALDAFMPALLALSGDVDQAVRLMESCYRMWTAFGIEPEVLDYTTMDAVYPGYVLRPEAIESAYYLYHFTGDPRYREMGRTMIDSVLTLTRTEFGFAALASVVTREQRDRMQSFFLAETLKYAYLLFAPPETLDFDAVTFNTEAHPIRAFGPDARQ